MRKPALFTALCFVALLSGSAMAQRAPIKIYLAPSDPSPDVRVSGRITSVAVDPSDNAGTVYRRVNGKFVMVPTGDPSGPVSVLAGRTIRLRIASANNQGPLLQKSSVPGSFEVPCDGSPTTPVTGVSTSSLIVTGEVSDTAFNWQTEESWKGTCRMTVVELTDRREYAIKVSFN